MGSQKIRRDRRGLACTYINQMLEEKSDKLSSMGWLW